MKVCLLLFTALRSVNGNLCFIAAISLDGLLLKYFMMFHDVVIRCFVCLPGAGNRFLLPADF